MTLQNSDTFLSLPNLFFDDIGYRCLSVSRDWETFAQVAEADTYTKELRHKHRSKQRSLGQAAALSAMSSINIPTSSQAITRDQFGAPIWPSGVVGSISHSGDLVVAVCSMTDKHFTLGIDVQKIVSLKKNILTRIANPEEISWAMARDSITTNSPPGINSQDLRALMLFSAKESVIKAYYQAYRQLLYPSLVSLNFIDQCQGFLAGFSDISHYKAGWPQKLMVRISIGNNYIISATAVDRTL